jgi:hypothetical protein
MDDVNAGHAGAFTGHRYDELAIGLVNDSFAVLRKTTDAQLSMPDYSALLAFTLDASSC